MKIKIKRTDNSGVIKAWKAGEHAKNGRGSLHTDGSALYSYDLHIGQRTAAGVCVLADYTARAKGYHSQTTSCHVNLAKRATVGGSVVTMNPKVWAHSPLSERVPF
jgi:hypothetical protein